MNTRYFFKTLLIILAFCQPFTLVAGGGHGDHDDHSEHGHDEPTDSATGPQGGKIFRSGDLAVEVTIFEENTDPVYRVFAYEDETLLEPDKYQVSLITERFMRGKEVFKLAPQENYQTSTQIVGEPHSFSVKINLKYENKDYWFDYDSFEGRTELSDEMVKLVNLEFAVAEPQNIYSNTEVFGRIMPNEDKVYHINPRFPGVIREIHKKLGDTVSKDELLAVIESNHSLQNYEVRAQSDGVVVKRHASNGEFVSEDREIFIIADLSEVWADFQVYRDDFTGISAGQEIRITHGSDHKEISAKVSYVSPLTDIATQSKLVRAVLANPDNSLRPGLFVSGVLYGSSAQAAVAVRRDAIQTFRDWQVVYITDGHIFQAMPVETGRSDRDFVEITSGLHAGDRYVSKNSFIIKADIEKNGASHDH